ncbi:MAG TPA: CHAT domain-containing protein [Bacteroidetes bacterium]|nr:CHAT domain-containing protein [Bacteroidota bacterium]
MDMHLSWKKDFISLLMLFASFAALSQGDPHMLSLEIEKLSRLAGDDSQAAVEFADSLLAVLPDGRERERGEVLFQKGRAEDKLKKHETALADLKLSKKKLDGYSLKPDSLKAEVLFFTGIVFTELHEYDSSLVYFNKSIDVKTKIYGEHSRQVILALNVLGGHHAGKGDVKSSLAVRYKALGLAEKTPGAEVELVKLYNNLGRLHLIEGDYERALPFFSNGLALNKRKVKNPFFQFVLCKNLIEIYGKMGQYEKALSFAHSVDSIFQQHPDMKRHHQYWTALGVLYFDMGKIDSALYCGKKAIDEALKDKPVNERFISGNLTDLANYYLSIEQYDSTEICAEKAIEIETRLIGEKSRDVAGNFRRRGLAAMGNNNIENAKGFFISSLKANNFNGSLFEILDYNEAILTFTELGKLYFGEYKTTAGASNLTESFKWLELADSALTFRRRELYNINNKDRLTESASVVYETAIPVCLQLQKLTGRKTFWDKAFYFSERRKGIGLSEAFQGWRAALDAGVQAECMEEQGELLEEIASLRHQRRNRVRQKPDLGVSQTAILDRQIKELTLRFDSLLTTVQQSCPLLSALKKQERTVSAGELQDWCKNAQTAILEYFLLENSLVIFAINDSGLRVEEVPLPGGFTALLGQFRQSISAVDIYEDDQRAEQLLDQYRQSAHRLYDILVKPVQPYLRQRLMAVPDGILDYVPFAALLEKEQPGEGLFELGSYPYLVRRHSIGYSYSATLLLQMEEKQHIWPPEQSFCGIAPDFRGPQWGAYGHRGAVDDDLQLLYNMPEVDSLHRLLGGVALTGRSAVKDSLMDNLFSRILHFSTHAFAFDVNSENSYLALHSEKEPDEMAPLYLWEIMHLSLSTDMVFLSACQTGLGRLTKTEGIVSLARAFAFAGTKNIHATLWSIKDAPEGVGLVLGFYKNLYEKGLPKDVAMQQAQLAFLEKYKGTEFAHPHFWAAFIGIGDRSALFSGKK